MPEKSKQSIQLTCSPLYEVNLVFRARLTFGQQRQCNLTHDQKGLMSIKLNYLHAQRKNRMSLEKGAEYES